MSRQWALLLWVAAAGSGCDWAERPRRAIPEHFLAQSLAGETIDADSLKGRPWVVNVWVPG